MSGIQRIPAGLLSFLGIRQPNNPRALGDTVVPVIDVSPYYQQPDLTALASANVAVSAEGDEARELVPAGESWKLIAVAGVLSGLTVAEVAYAYCGIGIDNGTGVPGITLPVYVMPEPVTVANATETIRFGCVLSETVILPPGGHIMAAIMRPMGAGAAIQVRALYHRLIQ